MPETPSSTQPILIVDDDEDSRIIFALALKNAGYEVITARDGEEGVRCAQLHRPALILMDIAMPVLDGLAALDALNADPECADIPVVALTSAASSHDEEILVDRGFERIVFKPIRPEQLVQLAEGYVPRGKAGAKKEKGGPAATA